MLYALILTLIITSGGTEEDFATVTFPNGTEITCELADTPELRVKGLSKHTSLSSDAGMLFVYPGPRLTSFWMPPEMKFNIDMIFMDENKKILHIAHNAQPCKDPRGWDCESYSPEVNVAYVLETASGIAKKNQLKNGVTLKISLPKNYVFPVQ